MKTNTYRSLLVSISIFSLTALLAQQPAPEQQTTPREQTPKDELVHELAHKDNFMVYMCNNNNLHQFGVQNYRQMVKVGSTDSMNLLLQMDEFGEKEIMRFFIERNNAIVVENQSNTLTSFSGTPANLIEFAEWGIKNYPSNKIILDLWNHGAGIKDPHIWGRMLTKWRDKLFSFNHKTGLLELNRNLTQKKSLEEVLLDFEKEERGIAFNDAAETYLTNEDLKISLDTIVKTLLNGKKIDLLLMDACHMAMVEIASQVKDAANYMVGSEEVEPGAGYNYYNVLKLFLSQNPDSETIAKHIVECYKNEYQDTVGDYTQSAIDLSYVTDLELAINKLSSILIDMIATSKNDAMKVLKEIRFNNSLATEFLDTDYIDLYHFLKSISLKGDQLSTHQKLGKLWADARDTAFATIVIMEKMIIANASGKNLPEAHGLSIYFPTTSVHSSYAKTEFARVTLWPTFLKKFLAAKKIKDAEDEIVTPAPEADKSLRCPCQDGKNKTKCSCQNDNNKKRCPCQDSKKKK